MLWVLVLILGGCEDDAIVNAGRSVGGATARRRWPRVTRHCHLGYDGTHVGLGEGLIGGGGA